MKLLEKIKNAEHGAIIEVDHLIDCCRNMKELEDIVIEIKKKEIQITSQAQPWINSEVLESLLEEAVKIRKKE